MFLALSRTKANRQSFLPMSGNFWSPKIMTVFPNSKPNPNTSLNSSYTNPDSKPNSNPTLRTPTPTRPDPDSILVKCAV